KPDRYLIRSQIVLPICFGASGFYFIHLDKLNWVLSKTKFISLCDCLKEEGIINGYKYYFYDEVIF
ncbi:TPA: hypothetical protein ACHJUX_004453, partial [Escherichia coli]